MFVKWLNKLYSYFFEVDLGTGLNYNPALDGLRGVSIILVVLFHYFPGKIPFGYIGVDLFFMISGFLITSIILHKLEKNRFSFKEFYRNRARRLFPALLIFLITALVLGYLLIPSYYYKTLGKHIFSSALYFQNVNLAKEIGYWDTNAHFKPLLHLWSLSVEEQFYLLWPLLLFIFFRMNILKPFMIVLVLLASFSLSLILSHYYPGQTFYNTFARWWELGIGGLLALLLFYKKLPTKEFNHKSILFILFILFVISIIYSYFALSVRVFSPLRLSIFLMVFFVILYFSVLEPHNVLFANKTAVAFGRLSYSLYLWHYLVLSFCFLVPLIPLVSEYHGIWPSRFLRVFLILLSIFFSMLSYRFIEVPLRKSHSYKLALTWAGMLVVVGMVGLFVYKNNGLPDRRFTFFKEENIENLQDLQRPASQDSNCIRLVSSLMGKKPSFSYCRATTSNPKDIDLILLGDSHAYAMYPGLSKVFKERGKNIILMAMDSYPATIMATGKSIKNLQQRKKSLKQILGMLSKMAEKKVLIVTRQSRYYYGKGFGEAEKAPKINKFEVYFYNHVNDSRKTYIVELEKMFEFLGKRRIYLLFENPELGFDPINCIVKYKFLPHYKCYVARRVFEKRVYEVRKRIREMTSSFKNITLLNADNVFCDKSKCYAIKNNILLYKDDDHISSAAGYLISNEIINKIMQEKKEPLFAQ